MIFGPGSIVPVVQEGETKWPIVAGVVVAVPILVVVDLLAGVVGFVSGSACELQKPLPPRHERIWLRPVSSLSN